MARVSLAVRGVTSGRVGDALEGVALVWDSFHHEAHAEDNCVELVSWYEPNTQTLFEGLAVLVRAASCRLQRRQAVSQPVLPQHLNSGLDAVCREMRKVCTHSTAPHATQDAQSASFAAK